MVIHFPHFLVVRIVVLLKPLVPVLSCTLDIDLDSLVDIDPPFSFDFSSFLRVDGSCNLNSFTQFGL